jgi:hypothetical protein
MPFQHDREFYRLPYPPSAAPQFLAGDVEHPVVDIGEGGGFAVTIRFANDGRFRLAVYQGILQSCRMTSIAR